MKKVYHIFIALFLLILANACDNFEEVNTNPDAATSVSPDMLATEILKGTYRFWNPNPDDFSTGNLWCKHTAILKTNPNPYQYYYSYWPYGGLGGYANLTSLKRMVEFSKGTQFESSYQGLALFLKAWYGYSSTIEMGDVPYSEAGMAEEGVTTPKYDKQADVFVQILNDLKTAEELFAKGKNFGGDIMFGGDVTKWRKLSNAMQLRVLQTISKKATTEQKTRFAQIVAANNLMKSNDDNFLLRYTDNPNSNHPFWNGENLRVYVAISRLAADALKKNRDRRLFYFAEPAKALIDGGKAESDFAAYEGAPTELAAEKLALNNENGMYSLLNKRYVEVKSGDPMLIFTYAEQCFILAEAVEEGWISGNAKEYYENGVKSQLQYYMNLSSATRTHGMPITEDYINNYFTGAAAFATDGSRSDRLNQILTQRWLIDFFQGNGSNSYHQFLRTGYPAFPLDPNTSMNPDDKTVYPKRWKYPTDEQTTNPINYQKAIDEQYGGYDGINQTPWWLQ